ncbi:hypothetical protein [Streptomyces sp. NPDC050988]
MMRPDAAETSWSEWVAMLVLVLLLVLVPVPVPESVSLPVREG